MSDDTHPQVHAAIEGRGGEKANGCNRLAFGVQKLPVRLLRPAKYSWLIHAEIDAIALAARQGLQTVGLIVSVAIIALVLIWRNDGEQKS